MPNNALYSITHDETTGLEWLDLTMTQGRSYDEVSSQLEHGGNFEGWRVASWTEAKTFFESVGILEGADGIWANNYVPTINPQRATSGFLLLGELMRLRKLYPDTITTGPYEAHLYLDGPRHEDKTWATYYELKAWYVNGAATDAMMSRQNSEDTIFTTGVSRATLLVRQT